MHLDRVGGAAATGRCCGQYPLPGMGGSAPKARPSRPQLIWDRNLADRGRPVLLTPSWRPRRWGSYVLPAHGSARGELAQPPKRPPAPNACGKADEALTPALGVSLPS